MLDRRYSAPLHAEGQYAVPHPQHHSRSAVPDNICPAAVRRPHVQLRRARRDDIFRSQDPPQLRPHLYCRLRPQYRFRWRRRLSLCGVWRLSGHQFQSDHEDARERSQRLQRQRPVRRCGNSSPLGVEHHRRLQIHPARCRARRFQRSRLPHGRHQRQGLLPEGVARHLRQHLAQRALVQRRRSVRPAARHRRDATRLEREVLMVKALAWIIVAALLPVLAAGPASAQSLEDRLRDQLRSTLNELHDAQDQQATLQAQKAAAEKERDTLKAELAEAQAKLAHAGESAAAKAQAQALAGQVAQYKAAADQANGTAQQVQEDRDKLQASLADSQKLLGVCEDKNTKLLKVGNEILDAYQEFDVGEAVAANEPFISIHRVELENMAQDFDDHLHEGKFDPNAKLPSSTPGKVPSAATPGKVPPATPDKVK